MTEEVKFLVIGGDIRPEPEDETLKLIHPFRPPVQVIPEKIEAVIKVYLLAEDSVREYVMSGVTGRVNVWEPTLEDRQAVSAHMAAQMLIEHGLDMHDFQEILGWALEGLLVTPRSPRPLFETVEKMHDQLGGY